MDIHKHLATGLWGADGVRTASAEKDGSLVTGTPLTIRRDSRRLPIVILDADAMDSNNGHFGPTDGT